MHVVLHWNESPSIISEAAAVKIERIEVVKFRRISRCCPVEGQRGREGAEELCVQSDQREDIS